MWKLLFLWYICQSAIWNWHLKKKSLFSKSIKYYSCQQYGSDLKCGIHIAVVLKHQLMCCYINMDQRSLDAVKTVFFFTYSKQKKMLSADCQSYQSLSLFFVTLLCVLSNLFLRWFLYFFFNAYWLQMKDTLHSGCLPFCMTSLWIRFCALWKGTKSLALATLSQGSPHPGQSHACQIAY